MGNRNLLSVFVAVIALSELFCLTPVHGQSVNLAVIQIQEAPEKVRKTGEKETDYTVRFRITNLGDSAVFFPRRGLGKPNGIDTLDIEMLQPDGSWKALPAHRELPALDQVKIGARDKYDDELLLDDPSYVSAWLSSTQQPYTIPLRGKLRLAVRYLASQTEWDEYVAAKSTSPSPASRKIRYRKVWSEPFTLP
jgi:hypothetical protein